jgi:hypothetical protein
VHVVRNPPLTFSSILYKLTEFYQIPNAVGRTQNFIGKPCVQITFVCKHPLPLLSRCSRYSHRYQATQAGFSNKPESCQGSHHQEHKVSAANIVLLYIGCSKWVLQGVSLFLVALICLQRHAFKDNFLGTAGQRLLYISDIGCLAKHLQRRSEANCCTFCWVFS